MGQHLSIQQEHDTDTNQESIHSDGTNAAEQSLSSFHLTPDNFNKRRKHINITPATATKQASIDSSIEDEVMDEDHNDLALLPITSPLDNPHQYPSTFFLSPITSNESQLIDQSFGTKSVSLDDNFVGMELDRNIHHPSTTTITAYSQDIVMEPTPPLEEQPHDVSIPRVSSEESLPHKAALGSSDTITAMNSTGPPASPLLSLPLEILYRIIEYVYVDNDISSINSNLEKFANTIPLLSKKFHHLSLCFLYKYTIFNRPHSFDKFLANLMTTPTIGKYVEFMDFQQFTSIGLGRTGRMNQEIQMVTSKTIAQALEMTPNLREFLASENIQDDLDVIVLDHLFNKLLRIKALDFCGASSEAFASAFESLIIQRDLNTITKISFHDCSNLTPEVFQGVLSRLINLQRLDLNHTSITSSILLENIPKTAKLTHLSLARCSKLTTKDLINFLIYHPAVSQASLVWLNLQIDSNVISPLSDIYLHYTLKHLNAPHLKYLNVGGMPVNSQTLIILKNKFSQLISLNISHAQVKIEDLHDYMKDNENIMYLDLTGIKTLTRFNLPSFLKRSFNSNLIAIEFDYRILYELTQGEHTKITQPQVSFVEESAPPQIWKFFDNEGRRAWIYKLTTGDPEYKSIMKGGSAQQQQQQQSNLVYYDLETGNKIMSFIKKPGFLKYAGRKVNCSIGYFNLNGYRNKNKFEDCWPVEFSQRGIYNYYSLNVK
ncbi:F-box protein [Spathaspora sp. JA1]|nr:F-box protein [Spathaspora sp. JA1]